MLQANTRELSSRLVKLRAELIADYPFFGRLLLHLPIGFADCGTAYTDMRRVVFDPSFGGRLDGESLKFVLLHEVLHCVLGHCTRGRGRHHMLYNVAADIVVNSTILGILGKSEIKIDGHDAMHLTPSGDEGRKYSADEVYDMLIRSMPPGDSGSGDAPITLDDHSVWEEVDESLGDKWKVYTKKAQRGCGIGSGIPKGLERCLANIRSVTYPNWRVLLHEFICHRQSDYTYTRPDARYSGDFIMPSFMTDIDGESVENLWFLIDTSGSVSDDELSAAYSEIEDAISQMDSLSGMLSFFDCEVTEPKPFESAEQLREIKPLGGGGTSFHAIFDALERYFEADFPTAIVIITDGCAAYPDESAARGIPVIWLLVDSTDDAPWGLSVHID